MSPPSAHSDLPDPAAAGSGNALRLWAIPLVYGLGVAAEFAVLTEAALQLTAAGRSATAVGLAAAALWSGILLSCLKSHRLVACFGSAPVFAVGLALAAAVLWLHSLSGAAGPAPSLAGIAVGMFALGLVSGAVWVCAESWLADIAPPSRRGFFVGVFETAVGVGLMTGPALLPLSAAWGLSAASIGAGLMSLAALAAAVLWAGGRPSPADPAWRLPGPAPQGRPDRADRGWPDAGWRRLMLPLAGLAALGGVMESGVSALLPSVAMRLGASWDGAAALGALIGAGSALSQPPAGWTADRLGVRLTLPLAWTVILAAALMLAQADQAPALLWAAGFLLGGAGGAVYTLAVIEIGQHVRGAALVRTVGALVACYSAGTAVGPVLGGWLVDAGGPALLGAALASLTGLGLACRPRSSPGPGRSLRAGRGGSGIVTPPSARS